MKIFWGMGVGMLLSCIAVAAPAAPREVRVHSVDQFRAAAKGAAPGTVILLEPGRYPGGILLRDLHGTPDEPIVIGSASPEHPAVIQGGNECLHLSDPRHVVLRDLVLRGAKNNDLNIDDGGTMLATASVMLQNLAVRDVIGRGNADGIKLSGLHDFTVENCLVTHWGAGGQGMDLVGCRDGKISRCTFRHDNPHASVALQLKGGSTRIVVDRCTFDHAGQRGVNIGGDTGLQYFRPQPPPHYEASQITVQNCTFVGCEAPVAFVGVVGATVRNNLIDHPGKWVFRILQEQRASGFLPCQGGVMEHNLIVFRHADVAHGVANIGDATDPQSFRFDANFWYCDDAPAQSRPTLPVPETGGIYGQNPHLTRNPDGSFALAPNSPASRVGPQQGKEEN